MHLKSLELTGFKSFSETKLEFPKGITAVVGPNGAGKSNVLDSILWVLGEQSTKTLRSERMEDVIFNGTQERKPLGMAEVSLVLSGLHHKNLEGLPGLPDSFRDYSEVMVTRRLYRNGDSEYLINKTPCRLKDLRALFLETRAGSKGHTIIEQGRIEQILNASPQDRRELIEETAGIVRYKKQKAEALRKLESTQQNLLRVRDIVTEVHRQLKSLERQARQARSYQELQLEVRKLEIQLLVRDYRQLSAVLQQVEIELTGIESREAEQMAEQARLGRQIEELRLGMTAVDGVITRLREQVANVEYQQSHALTAIEVERNRIELFEQQRAQTIAEQARLLREQDVAKGQIESLRVRLAEIDGEIARNEHALSYVEESARSVTARRAQAAEQEAVLRQTLMVLTVETTNQQNAVTGLESRREELLRRMERLDGERQQVENEQRVLQSRIQQVVKLRQEADQRLAEWQRAREEGLEQEQQLEDKLRQIDLQLAREQESFAAVKSRLEALQGVIREEMGYGRKGEEDTTSLRAGCDGIREAVAEWLTVPAGYERAFEAVLGERVRAWLVDHPAHAKNAIQFLRDKRLGRGTFVPSRPRWSRASAQPEALWWETLRDQSGVLGRAVDLAQASGRDDSQDILMALFGRVVIVQTLETAIRLWEAASWTAPDGPILVTLEGELLDAAGLISGGSLEGSKGLLQRRRETQQLEQERAGLTTAIRESREMREQWQAKQEALRATLQQCDQAIREADAHRLSLATEEAALGPGLQGLERREQVIGAERTAAEEERSQTEQELDERRQKLNYLIIQKTHRETTLVEVQQALQSLDEETQQLQSRLLDSRLALAEVRSQREHGEADLDRFLKDEAERQARSAGFEQELAGLTTAIERSDSERDRSQRVFQDLDQRASQLKSELTAAQEAQAKDMAVSHTMEQQLSGVRDTLGACRDARMAVEVRRAEVKTQLGTLDATLSGTYQLSVAQALEEHPPALPGLAQGRPAHAAGQEGSASSPDGDAPPQAEVLDEATVLRAQLQKIRERLNRMGPINLAAIEEHRELEERYHFLTSQQEDLTNSIASLKEIISRINRTTKQMFMETFNELQQKFGEVFGRFFPGGRAELVLVDPKDLADPIEHKENGNGTNGGPNGTNGHSNGGANGEAGDTRNHEQTAQDPGVDIVAQPPGKRLKSIAMLSGGEKTLTAMALIFASFLIRPTPFCILDEIDAPLDEENIGRFTGVLRELAQTAQFIVITHSKHTMAVADSLFGVTMEEPGVSKVVSVRLADLQPA
jgi:chromosome segregation protein